MCICIQLCITLALVAAYCVWWEKHSQTCEPYSSIQTSNTLLIPEQLSESGLHTQPSRATTSSSESQQLCWGSLDAFSRNELYLYYRCLQTIKQQPGQKGGKSQEKVLITRGSEGETGTRTERVLSPPHVLTLAPATIPIVFTRLQVRTTRRCLNAWPLAGLLCSCCCGLNIYFHQGWLLANYPKVN